MAVTIREALPEDYAGVGRLTLQAYEALFDMVRIGEYRGELLNAKSRAEEATLFVAEEDGALLGGVTYVGNHTSLWSEWDDPDAGGFRMLAVTPAAQGKGVGRLLAERCLKQARAEGKKLMLLHSTPEMVTAHRLYESFGFERDPSIDFSAEQVVLWGFRLEL